MTKKSIETNSNSGAINESGQQHFNACFFISILDYFKFNNLIDYVSIKDLKSNVYHNCEMFDSDNYQKNINVINYLNDKQICCVVYKYFYKNIDDDIFQIIGDYNNAKYIIKICNFGLGHFEFITKFDQLDFNHPEYIKINTYNTHYYKYNHNEFDIKSLNKDLNFYYNSIKLIVRDITCIVDEFISYRLMFQNYDLSQLIKFYDYFKLLYQAYNIKFDEIIKNSSKSFEQYKLSNLNAILLFEDIKEYFLRKYDILLNNNHLVETIDSNDNIIKDHIKNPKSVIIINYLNSNHKIDISFIHNKIINNIDKLANLDYNNIEQLNLIIEIFKTD